jgi:hypothetical protein
MQVAWWDFLNFLAKKAPNEQPKPYVLNVYPSF